MDRQTPPRRHPDHSATGRSLLVEPAELMVPVKEQVMLLPSAREAEPERPNRRHSRCSLQTEGRLIREGIGAS